MKRKLFCEISPTTYKISMEKEILLRKMKDTFSNNKFAKEKNGINCDFIWIVPRINASCRLLFNVVNFFK